MATEAVLAASISAPLRTLPASAGSGSPGYVLLVEDDPRVRAAIGHFLRFLGFPVLEAADAAEALRASRPHWGEIALLLTDVVLPGINGLRLAERMRAVLPRLRVLYMSGYPEGDLVRRGIGEVGEWFLQKPITPGQLAEKLSAVLAARGASETWQSAAGWVR